MSRPIVITLLLVLSLLSTANSLGQIAGLRATQESTDNASTRLSVAAANSHIAIEGTCQKRVVPTSIRLIWAVTSEQADAVKCGESIRAAINRVGAAWEGAGIKSSAVVEDFISAIPQFEWTRAKIDDETLWKEVQVGYRMQTNLHVRVDSGEQAEKVIDVALANGLSDLIGVDYTADLELPQEQARTGAVQAAKKKAELLLSAVFSEAPSPINVQEQTQVFFPDQMYHSFENVASRNSVSGPWSDMRQMSAYRPQNTYYSGLTRAADDKSYVLPMNPEIIVESKVVIYYASPSTRKTGDDDE